MGQERRGQTERYRRCVWDSGRMLVTASCSVSSAPVIPGNLGHFQPVRMQLFPTPSLPQPRGDLWPSYMLTVTRSKCTHFWMVSGVTHLCSSPSSPCSPCSYWICFKLPSTPPAPPLAGITHCGTQWRTTTITYAAERVHEMPPSFLSLFQPVGFHRCNAVNEDDIVLSFWSIVRCLSFIYDHENSCLLSWATSVYQWFLFLLLIFCCFCNFFF